MLTVKDDLKNKILELTHEIHRLELLKINSENEDEIEKLNNKMMQLSEDVKRMQAGYDIKLANKVLRQFDYDGRCDTVESYKNGKEMETDMVYTQMHKTDIIMEYPSRVMWTEYNKNIGDRPGMTFYHNGIDQLLYYWHKQVLNIPVNLNPQETFEYETRKLIDLVKKFMQEKYDMVAQGGYIVKHRDDIDPKLCDNINMAYIVIPSQCVNNYRDKVEFIQLFREYVTLNNNIHVENRIGFCKLHRHIPNVEIMIPQLTKTTSEATADMISTNKEAGLMTNVDRPIVPVVIISNDNSTINNTNNNANINGNNINAIVTQGNVGAANVTDNTLVSRVSRIKSNMNKCREYLELISNNPPDWHTQGSLVTLNSLYELYRTTGGTALIHIFGQFLSKCSSIYERLPKEYIDKTMVQKFKIL